MTLHTYNPSQCPYQVSTSYTLRFLRYSPDKVFPTAYPPTHLLKMDENNSPTALKGCWVKSCSLTCDLSDWSKCHDTIFRKVSHRCANFEENLPSGCRAISNRKCGSRQPLPCEFLLYTNKRPIMDA